MYFCYILVLFMCLYLTTDTHFEHNWYTFWNSLQTWWSQITTKLYHFYPASLDQQKSPHLPNPIPYIDQVLKITITNINQLAHKYIFSLKPSSFNASHLASNMLFLLKSPLHCSCNMLILLTSPLHLSSNGFMFLRRPGMMVLLLAHIGGSTHPINPQTESLVGQA